MEAERTEYRAHGQQQRLAGGLVLIITEFVCMLCCLLRVRNRRAMQDFLFA